MRDKKGRYIKGHSQSNTGRTQFKKGLIPKNAFIFIKSERKFKGTPSEYKNLHRKIRNQLGSPEVCTNCDGIFSGHKIHWANKSGEYRKELSDWLALCTKCHYQYDEQELRKEHYGSG